MYNHLIRGEMTLIDHGDEVTVQEIGAITYFIIRLPMALVFGAIY